MTLSTGLIFGIIFILMFIVVMATISEGLVKIAAKHQGENPENYGVLPNDLPSMLNRSEGSPDYVSRGVRFVFLKYGFLY